MTKESMDANSEQDDLIFPSKRDAWLVGTLWLVILVSAAGAVYTFTLSLSIVSLFVQEVMWVGIIAFCLSILRSTYYTIKADSLEVRSGPFKWTTKVLLVELTSHLRTKDTFSRSLRKGRRLSGWRATGWFEFLWNRRNSVNDKVLTLDDGDLCNHAT
jgi:hypothetical protein